MTDFEPKQPTWQINPNPMGRPEDLPTQPYKPAALNMRCPQCGQVFELCKCGDRR